MFAKDRSRFRHNSFADKKPYVKTEVAGTERLEFHHQQGCCLTDGVKTMTVRVWAAAETQAIATLDTGSRLNWISKDVAERIGAQIESLDDDDNNTFQLMDGTAMQPLGKVEAMWHKDGKIPNDLFRSLLSMLENGKAARFPASRLSSSPPMGSLM